jgi:cysteinyl-tRNA synthetase
MRSGSSGKVGGRSANDSDLNYSSEEKISRSKGAGGLSTLINRYGGECIRFFLLRTHYRSTILYEDDSLNESETSLMSFYRFFSRFSDITGKSFYDMSAPRRRTNLIESEVQDNTIKDAINLRESFLSAMDDDFNTGLAVSFLFDLVRLINRHIDLHNLSRASDASKPAWMVLMKSTEILRELSLLLGLFKKPRSESAHSVASTQLANSLMQMIIDLRKQARQSRDYATSDSIRNRLGELNIQLLDKNDHTSWEFGT